MKPRFSPVYPRRAVALVVTLILLSVILVVTLALLAISRRERSSVNTAQQLIDAEFMANAAAERAKAAVASRILGYTNLAAGSLGRPMRAAEVAPEAGFDPIVGHDGGNLIVSTSTNSLDPLDYTPSYLASLHFDPRTPVFVRTNLTNAAAPLDFRYYLDLNRNGKFESNGFFHPLGNDGKAFGTNRYWHSGDPEWIGVLEHPDAPHSASNRFIGRYAFVVVPAGRALDLNSIHNNAGGASLAANSTDGFRRHQGVGTYEINLAAFLADLNANAWAKPTGLYNFDLPPPYGRGSWVGQGTAFDQARALLKYRYDGDRINLPTLQQWLGDETLQRVVRPNGFLLSDQVDWYADDGYTTIIDRAQGLPGLADDDVDDGKNDPAGVRWPGVESPKRFNSINDYFKAKSGGIANAPYYSDFSRDLRAVSTNSSSYDRYTYYRLLSQMSTAAGGGEPDRIDLRFKNTDGTTQTDFIPWTPTDFFNTVADRLIKETFRDHHTNDQFSTNLALRYNLANGSPLQVGPLSSNAIYLTNLLVINANSLSITNIPIYPTNYYNVALHRLLQVAANLYEANATNPMLGSGPSPSGSSALYPPTIYRPIFRRASSGGIVIAGYQEDDGLRIDEDNFWWTIQDLAEGRVVPSDPPDPSAPIYVYGVPPIVAARKGFPSLNEIAILSTVDVARKLLITKTRADENLDEGIKQTQLRVMPLVTATNIFAVEMINAYTSAYPRNLRLTVAGRVQSFMRAGNGIALTQSVSFKQFATNLANSWRGGLYTNAALRVPLMLTNVLTAWATFGTNGVLDTNVQNRALFGAQGEFAAPRWTFRTTNLFRLVLYDTEAKRVVDVVSLNRLETPSFDVTPAAIKRVLPGVLGEMWLTNINQRVNLPQGEYTQIQVSRGQQAIPANEWLNPVFSGANILEIENFKRFYIGSKDNTNLVKQAPYTPHVALYRITSWQANDPLVHYMVDHLLKASPTNYPHGLTFPLKSDGGPRRLETGVPLDDWNIGRLNERVTPWYLGFPKLVDWDGVPVVNGSIRDPLMRTPDEWNFPMTPYASLGDIGGVHRGTPWQTIFLKAQDGAYNESEWMNHVGSDVVKRWRPSPDVTDVANYARSYLTYPTNDWLLLDYLKVSPSPQAEVGAIGVNQDGLAAWSAVMSGVVVLTNLASTKDVDLPPTNAARLNPIVIQPALNETKAQMLTIVNGINAKRRSSGGTFQSLGGVFSVPELSFKSPYLNTTTANLQQRSISEEAFEALPRRIASLVRKDQSRYEIYAFGQALQPAPDSLIKNPLDPYYNVCTNYQVVAEMNTRTVLRFENQGPRPIRSQLAPRAMFLKPFVESFQSLSED